MHLLLINELYGLQIPSISVKHPHVDSDSPQNNLSETHLARIKSDTPCFVLYHGISAAMKQFRSTTQTFSK